MMRAQEFWSIPGGVHPPTHKAMSTDKPIAEAPLPKQIVLPISQHIGKPAQVIVKVGEQVLRGQKVAQATTAMSACVHASISGTVTAIEARPIPHSAGLSALCVVIDSDGKDEEIEPKPLDDYQHQSQAALLKAIQNAGIAGLGGAGFPSAVKLAANQPYHIHTLIINAAECEPYITADDMLVRERVQEVISGIKIAQQLVQADECIIGIEDDKPESYAALKEASAQIECKVVRLPTKYPSGGEKQLIYLLTGKELPIGTIPPDSGIVCMNVGTLAAIHRAIVLGKPLTSRVVTVTGHGVSEPRNYEARIGMSFRELLKSAGWQEKKTQRLVMGGPMMGFSMPTPDVPVIKTTNCVLAVAKNDLGVDKPEMPCIRCGACADACPVSLLPQQLYWHISGNQLEKAQAIDLFSCIECGACSYVCPSHIPLVQYYRAAKAEIKNIAKERQKADHARRRFEFRNERIEKEKQAKLERQRKAAEMRKQASEQSRASEIQAAVARAKEKKRQGE